MNVYFDTLGCLKNFNDSDIAAGYLKSNGHAIVTNPEDADVIIVNTCGFIEDAKKESISEIFEMAEYKEQGKKLVVTGCLVQRYASELYKEIPEADGFLGVNDYEKLAELLNEFASENPERFLFDSEYDAGKLDQDSALRAAPAEVHSASIRISEGCNKGCAYCIIPKIRGPYRSRTMDSIVKEAEMLANAGTKELLVIAEDTSCYGIDLYGKLMLPELLRKLCQIQGIQWIRLLYCYEDHITDELIQVMAEEEKICNYIDIPLQHASDKVLKDMRRISTKASMTETITKLRAAMPDITIRTTMIVGFPGETEEEFQELLEFAGEMKFDRLGAFAYSKEEGTPAAEREDQIPEEVKQERLDRIMMQQMEISRLKNEEKIGKTIDVIVDQLDEDGVSYLGRTRSDAPDIDNSVIFTTDQTHEPGDIVSVHILDAFDYDLEGEEVSK